MTIHIVYKHTCVKNGKSYIGMTPISPKVHDHSPESLMQRRWKRHVYDAKKRNLQYPFHCAIRKHGENCFKHEILKICDTPGAALVEEKTQIRIHESRTHQNGYNVTPGGNGCVPTKTNTDKKSVALIKRWSDPENRKKLSKSVKKAYESKELRKKLKTIMKEVANRPEEKKRRSEIAKRKFSKKIHLLIDDKHLSFSSITDASRNLKIPYRELQMLFHCKISVIDHGIKIFKIHDDSR